MLWEVEIETKGTDAERLRVNDDYTLLSDDATKGEPVLKTTRGYILEGELSSPQAAELMAELLVDHLTEKGRLNSLS